MQPPGGTDPAAVYEGVRARVDALTAEVAERGAAVVALQAQLAAAAERHGAGMADAERQRQVGPWAFRGVVCYRRCARSCRPVRARRRGDGERGAPASGGCLGTRVCCAAGAARAAGGRCEAPWQDFKEESACAVP